MSDFPTSDLIQRWSADTAADFERGSTESLKRLGERPPQMETAYGHLNEQAMEMCACVEELESRLANVVRPSGDDVLSVPALADAAEFARWPREILLQAERIQAATVRIKALLGRLEV